MELLPPTAVNTITSGFLDVVSDNIVGILAVLAFAWAVNWVMSAANSAMGGGLSADERDDWNNQKWRDRGNT